MRSKSSRSRDLGSDQYADPLAGHDLQSTGEENANSADEVIGEMGLVLVVILGIVVALNLMLTSLHIS